MTAPDRLLLRRLYRRALAAGDPGLAQVWFEASVLERYRQAGYTIGRTDTIGRLQRQGGFSLDFGIADGDRLIHVAMADLLARLPEGEWEHWAEHAVGPPASENFLKTRLAPGSCIDDGEFRRWE